MPTIYDVAIDQMYALFKVTWDADTPAVNGSVIPQVFYDGVTGGEPPHNAAWARIQIRHIDAPQATLGDTTTKRRFENTGVLLIEISAANETTSDKTLAQNLAKIAKSAFQGKTSANGAVWFRDVRVQEIGTVGPWYRLSVVAEFRYDELV